MRIGQVAKSAGITVEAIHFYYKEDLIEIPSRTSYYTSESTDIFAAKTQGFVPSVSIPTCEQGC